MFLIIRRYFSASSPRSPLFKNKSSKASVISQVLRREEAEMNESEDDEDERLLSSMTRNSASKNGSILKSRLSDEMKLVLLIRTDINMQKGKAAAQCCHATLANYKQCVTASSSNPVTDTIRKSWEFNGQPKITLKVNSESEMLELVVRARQVGLIANYIRDAGRTQVESGTKTVAAIGPGPKSIIDQITGHLKLY